jgi:hypothetical protein
MQKGPGLGDLELGVSLFEPAAYCYSSYIAYAWADTRVSVVNLDLSASRKIQYFSNFRVE